MTMNVYGRTRNERLVQTVERVGEMVSVEEKHARSVPEPADTTTGDEGYTQVFQEVTTGVRTMPKGGFEPPRPVRHHPLKMACLPSSTTSASFYISKAGVFEPLELSDCAAQLSMGFSTASVRKSHAPRFTVVGSQAQARQAANRPLLAQAAQRGIEAQYCRAAPAKRALVAPELFPPLGTDR